ncbi:MAG: SIR2 family NAD-dependent protein deacylase [Limisphaerales bacterium]|jgi:NAD-dependent deacetylase
MINSQSIQIPIELVKLLKNSKNVVALTGAGVSAESGLSTFRNPKDGLFANVKIEDVATPDAFRRNPRLVWEWYEMRREKVTKAIPNPGHYALAKLEKLIHNFYVITQNVDGLHKKAGSQKVIELHGNILRNKCFLNNHQIDEPLDSNDIPPRCPICGSYIRPDVVWFGEYLNPEDIEMAEKLTKNCEVFLSIGTSSVVYPAAGLISMAKENHATVVEINPEKTEKSHCADFIFRYPSGAILPRLVNELLNYK